MHPLEPTLAMMPQVGESYRVRREASARYPADKLRLRYRIVEADGDAVLLRLEGAAESTAPIRYLGREVTLLMERVES